VKIATTTLQTYNTVQQQYNLYRQMMNSPNMLYQRFLSPRSDLMLMQQISNTYGNSMGWLNASNMGTGAAASYQQAVVPRTPTMVPGYGTTSYAGQQQIAAQGATIDIGDSVMSTNLQVLGTIRANQIARQTDITNLENATLSQDASQQTIMATLQRINLALLLELRNQQDANQINANLALQQMVAQKQQQDALKAGFMDAGNFNNIYQTQVVPAYNGAAQALAYLGLASGHRRRVAQPRARGQEDQRQTARMGSASGFDPEARPRREGRPRKKRKTTNSTPRTRAVDLLSIALGSLHLQGSLLHGNPSQLVQSLACFVERWKAQSTTRLFVLQRNRRA
jgi:hypothetical protein